MEHPISLRKVEYASVRATDWTEWVFAELHDDQGMSALVEITCGDVTGDVVTALTGLLSELEGAEITDESRVAELLGLPLYRLHTDVVLATALSALRTAIVDIQSCREGVSMTEALGGVPRDSVPLYANINRSLLGGERTPRAFAGEAERAVADGFTSMKCAPFDEVDAATAGSEILSLARRGLERVAAVRAAVGPSIQVLVDCHSRFDEASATMVAADLMELDVGWFEEPLQPATDGKGLARLASGVAMPVAGGESGYGELFFTSLVEIGAVSIVMPDVRFCGGLNEAYRAGMAAMDAGAHVSLHSPAGPVSQLASAHATAAMPGALALEYAGNEVPWRADLLVPRERVERGRFWFSGGTAVGASLNDDLVSRHGRRWTG